MNLLNSLNFCTNLKLFGKDTKSPHFTYGLENRTGTIDDIIALLRRANPVFPYHLKDGHRCNSSWDGANLFFIDIDDGMTLAEAKEKFKESALLIHTTTNHQKEKKGVTCDRFRVMFALPKKVENPTVITFLYVCATKIFGHDRNITAYSQGYLSPLKSEITVFNETNRLDVGLLVERYFFESCGNNLRRKIGKLGRQTALPSGKLLDAIHSYVIECEQDFPYLYNNKTTIETWKNSQKTNTSQFSPKNQSGAATSTGIPDVPPAQTRRRRIINYDFEYMFKNCLLVQNINATAHGELFHIACNLNQIEGGRKYFLELTKDRPFDEEQRGQQYYASLISDIDYRGYVASNCHETKCRYFGNGCEAKPYSITYLRRLLRGQVKRIDKSPGEHKTLQEGRDWLRKTAELLIGSGAL
jgi:hypothetical protein